MGVKPLYYAQCPDAFVFASELKALLASGLVSREISPSGLVGYLLMGSVPNPLTIYQGVFALPPATSLRVSPARPDRAIEETYWHLSADEGEPVGTSEAVERIGALLAESVRIRLVSDVPLGAFLSGGLDSSSVVAFMRQATDGPIRTCSMAFAEPGFSEARMRVRWLMRLGPIITSGWSLPMSSCRNLTGFWILSTSPASMG